MKIYKMETKYSQVIKLILAVKLKNQYKSSLLFICKIFTQHLTNELSIKQNMA